MSSQKDWKRLAAYATRRRAELGLTQIEVAQRGPLSLDRVQSIEGAKRSSYRLATLLALERALEWERGSVERVLAGGEPGVAAKASAQLAQPSTLTARATVEPSARADDLPDDPSELVRIARRFLDDSREHRRRSEELYSRAEEILRRLSGVDESANRDAS